MGDRVASLREAVASIPDGSVVALGGSILRRHPMALVHELVRQGKRDLVLLGWNNALDVDLLVAAGCVRRVETSYVGLYVHGLAPNFRRAVEQGRVEVVEWSETSAQDRFKAGASGLTFYPSKVLLGSDLHRRNPQVREVTCPFTGERYAAVPAATPDVALVHMHYSDRRGNVGLLPRRVTDNEVDILIAKSARRAIVSVEQIVSDEYVREHAHDLDHVALYKEHAASDEAFQEYLDRFVRSTRTHEEYLGRVGLRHLLRLRRPNPLVG